MAADITPTTTIPQEAINNVPTASASDISKEEILRQIFGEIGELIEGTVQLL